MGLGRKRNYPTKVDKLPQEIKAEIARLRISGWEIDAILDELRKLGVKKTELSRSGLGRHIKTLEFRTQEISRARSIAEGMIEKLGVNPENKIARYNIELMHDVIATQIDEILSGKEITSAQILQHARSIQSLTAADKHIAESYSKIRKEERENAASAFEKEAKAKGMTTATVESIKRAILGVS